MNDNQNNKSFDTINYNKKGIYTENMNKNWKPAKLMWHLTFENINNRLREHEHLIGLVVDAVNEWIGSHSHVQVRVTHPPDSFINISDRP